MQRRSGMTLVEVLVALTLAGSISAAGYTLWQQSLAAREHAHDVLEPVSRAATARTLLTNWLSAAHTTGNVDGAEFNGSQVLTFLTNDARPLADGPAIMRLSVDSDSLTQDRGLVAEVWDSAGRVRRMELIAEATAIEFAYFGSVEDVRQWWPSWRSAVLLPEAVRLTVTSADAVRTVNSVPLVVLLMAPQ